MGNPYIQALTEAAEEVATNGDYSTFAQDLITILMWIFIGIGAIIVPIAIFFGFQLAYAQDEGKRREVKKRLMNMLISAIIIMFLIGAMVTMNLAGLGFQRGPNPSEQIALGRAGTPWRSAQGGGTLQLRLGHTYTIPLYAGGDAINPSNQNHYIIRVFPATGSGDFATFASSGTPTNQVWTVTGAQLGPVAPTPSAMFTIQVWGPFDATEIPETPTGQPRVSFSVRFRVVDPASVGGPNGGGGIGQLRPGDPMPTPLFNVLYGHATRRLGIPYLWGGNGPAGYDCSGFIQAVFRDTLQREPPFRRQARLQHADTARVSRSDLRPGDLVFWGNNTRCTVTNRSFTITHSAIYIGNNQVIDSASAGSGGVAFAGVARRPLGNWSFPVFEFGRVNWAAQGR